MGEQHEEDADFGIELDEEEEVSVRERNIHHLLSHWEKIIGTDVEKLLLTEFKPVESTVGKQKQSHTEQVAGVAVRIGGGW